MFETPEFRRELVLVARQIQIQSVKQIGDSVVDILQFLAELNEAELMQVESRRPAFERRGIPEALASAKNLMTEATLFAYRARSSEVRLTDLRDAYQAKFCQFWPFCK